MSHSVLTIRLTPRARRNEISQLREGVLYVKVTAPPVEGAANRALLALLSQKLDVPPSALCLISGETSRIKRIRVEGLDEQTLWARLGLQEKS